MGGQILVTIILSVLLQSSITGIEALNRRHELMNRHLLDQMDVGIVGLYTNILMPITKESLF